MRTKFILMAFILFILTGCLGNGVQSKLDKALSEIEYAEKHKSQMTADDWSNLKVMIEELEADLVSNRNTYNKDQIKQIGIIQGKYTALVFKDNLDTFQESIKDIDSQIEGFIEGIQSDTLIE